jgi:hypothetical protein
MRVQPDLNPPVADLAPADGTITLYDGSRAVVYLRLLDAVGEGADWREVARLVLDRDPNQDEAGGRRCYDSHLARAQWLSEQGHRHLLKKADGDEDTQGRHPLQ